MAYVPKPTLIFCVDTETGGFNPSVNALSTLIMAVVTLILILVNVIPYARDKHIKKEEA